MGTGKVAALCLLCAPLCVPHRLCSSGSKSAGNALRDPFLLPGAPCPRHFPQRCLYLQPISSMPSVSCRPCDSVYLSCSALSPASGLDSIILHNPHPSGTPSFLSFAPLVSLVLGHPSLPYSRFSESDPGRQLTLASARETFTSRSTTFPPPPPLPRQQRL